ncbi:MAG: hypothetical protein PHN42_03080 [Bacilli bacterium]|nr:hypothetical protein [Bacilli bacterium]
MKKNYTVSIEANKIYKQKLIAKIAKIMFLLFLVVFTIFYFLVYVLYSNGNFVVSLDKNIYNNKNIFLSEDGSFENMKLELKAETLDYMDNISINWINQEVDNEANGSHNGTNYIAYTFYVVNGGSEVVNYWYQIAITGTIKNVDEAIRVMVFRNGEKAVYAKKNKTTALAEAGTETFYSDDLVLVKPVEKFEPGEKDKFTIVIWLEGDDPECLDDIIGGELKLQMDISEEHLNDV